NLFDLRAWVCGFPCPAALRIRVREAAVLINKCGVDLKYDPVIERHYNHLAVGADLRDRICLLDRLTDLMQHGRLPVSGVAIEANVLGVRKPEDHVDVTRPGRCSSPAV